MRHLRALYIAVGFVVFAAPSLARDGEETNIPLKNSTAQEIREESLDRLFASLRKSSGERAAKATEEKIWELWSRSDSATAEVLLGQAIVAMNASENAASLEILDRIVAAYPTYAEAWNRRATLHFMLGNYETSLSDIEKVLDLEPRHFGALAGRGMIYQRQGKWSAALSAFKEALSMNPNMAGVKNAVQELSKREQDI
ncbi:MAG TPA: tetratricopeptide repeat protein [Aestuariivirga sp.]|jgi:tetratricopeptide (TPR) repeat protein|nr:tetratricopeptide repeat protein [Aestuariivirga sp.]